MLKKFITIFSLAALLIITVPQAEVKATSPGVTLGIIGTALGGTALGLGALNTWTMYRRGFYGRRSLGGYPQGGYYQPVNYGYGYQGYPAAPYYQTQYGGGYGCGYCY